MTPLDWAIIALYFLFATGIGIAMSRRGPSRSLGGLSPSNSFIPWFHAAGRSATSIAPSISARSSR